MARACPTGPQWDILVQKIGIKDAMAEYIANDYNVPDVDNPRFDNYITLDSQISRAVDKFELYPIEKAGIRGYASRAGLAGKQVVTRMNEWFNKRRNIYPSLGAYIDTGNPVIQFGRIRNTQNTYAQLSDHNNNQKAIKDELRKLVIQGIGSTPEEDTIQTALAFFRAKKGTGEKGRGTSKEQDQWNKEFVEHVKTHMWYDNKLPEEYKIGQGNEQQVYSEPGSEFVTKFNVGTYTSGWRDYLQGLLIHNYFFPNTSYELLGFTDGGFKNDVRAVVKQQFIDDNNGNNYAEISDIEALMRGNGFEKLIKDNYINREIGVNINDLHNKNVVVQDGVLFVIDDIIVTHPSFFEDNNNLQLATGNQEPVDKELNKKIESFIKSLGGTIRYVQDIIVDGKIIDANAVADTIVRTVELAEGKIGIDTLPEEAAHIYVQWLPDNSPLLRDMLKDIRTRPIYDQVMAQYSSNPLYQHSDGTVDEDKIAREAIGKVIAGAIVGQYKDKKAKGFLQRILEWVKSLFYGKDFNSYEVAASDILSGKRTRLDMAAIKEANSRGQLYLQLSDKEREYIETIRDASTTTSQQKLVIDSVYLNPADRVVLNEQDHVYTDGTNIYTSVTTKLNGAFENDADYIQNRQWGTDFDAILEGIALGKGLRDIETSFIPDDLKGQAYGIMQGFYRQLTEGGAIVLPQVVVYDKQSKTAGSIDLLVVYPNGSTAIVDLKSVRTDSSLTTAHKPGEGSVISDSLTKRQKHGIQVATYRKLLALMGYPGASTAIKYIDLNITGKKTNQELKGLSEGEWLPLEPTAYQQYADTIVPTIWEGKDIMAEQGFTNPLDGEDYRQSLLDSEQERLDAVNELTERVNSIYKAAESWKERLNDIRSSVAFRPGNQTFEKVDRLLADIEHAVDTKQDYSQAYTIFLESAKKQLNDIRTYLTAKDRSGNLKHINDPAFLKITSLAAQYIDTFGDLIHTERFATPSQKRLYDEVDRSLREVGVAILQAQDTAAAAIISDNTVNDLAKGALAAQFVKSDKDLAKGEDWLGSLGGTTLLDNTAKMLTGKREEVREQAEQKEHRIDEVANRLHAAGVTDYDFMQVIENGKRTGIAVNRIGSAYRTKLLSVDAPLINDDGSYKQYIPITDLKTASAEDIAFNKQLWRLKRNRADFMEAEHIEYNPDDESLTIRHGDYHQYTPEFLAERARYMQLTRYGKWVLKNQDKESLEWRNLNMDYTTYTTMFFDKGEPTGQTREISDFFPKNRHIVMRDVSEQGVKLTDDRYDKLMNPNPANSKEMAQSEFYKLYMDIMREEISKLPPYAMTWFEKGYIPTLRGNFLQMVNEQGSDLGALIMSQIKDLFSVTAHTNNNTDGKGIPIMFMNKLQDQARLKDLRQKLADLVDKKDSMDKTAYWKEYDRLKGLIKEEEGRIKGEEVIPDMALALKAFVHMAENFHIMSGVEEQLLVVKKTLEKMEFDQGGKTVQGKDSRAYRRFNEWMDMVFYNDDSFTKDMAEVIIKRLQNVTSTMSIPFNLFGMINNSLMAKINNHIDAIGSDFFKKHTLRSSIKEFHTEFLPGYVRTIGEHKTSNQKYGHPKAGSLYQWLAREYNMVRKMNTEATGRVDWLAKLGGYVGYEGGEYMVQSQVGMAILRSINVKNTKTGEEVSIHDAYTFDPNTGQGKLKEGYEISPKQRHDITHRIWKTNERIHGNYDSWNKTVLEKYWVGRLAMQFHKWVYPAFAARFQRARFDENLGGGMDIEGRYVTLWNFIKNINRLGIGTRNWGSLTTHQKNNLKKDLADALYICTFIAVGTIMKAIADGIPDEDPYLKKFVNWVQYQSDRGVQEVSLFIPFVGQVEAYKLVSNPFAATNSLNKFAHLIKESAQYPFVDDEDRYYQKGPFKDQLKARKALFDVLPILKTLNGLTLLDTQRNFYIP